jgi:hypothetical protein
MDGMDIMDSMELATDVLVLGRTVLAVLVFGIRFYGRDRTRESAKRFWERLGSEDSWNSSLQDEDSGEV